jgi:hypothetical protein
LAISKKDRWVHYFEYMSKTNTWPPKTYLGSYLTKERGGGGSAGALATCNQQQQQLHALTDTWISWWLIHALICSFFSWKTMGIGGISSRS